MTFQFCVSKVTLQRDKMDTFLIAGGKNEVVEIVGLVLFCSCEDKVTDTNVPLGIVQVMRHEVGIDVARQFSSTELLCEFGCSRSEVADRAFHFDPLGLLGMIFKYIFCHFAVKSGRQILVIDGE